MRFRQTINHVSFLGNESSRNLASDTGRKYSNQQNSFYSLEDASAINKNANAIQAVIHETQSIVDGSTVKLRLVNGVFINGVLIPANNFVFGTAALSGERLGITIHSIRYNNSLFPVELSVFDMDGMSSLYIPGAITRDVAKQSAERGLQDVGFTSLNPSIGTQAASAGIEAAKTLLRKKVKLIKVKEWVYVGFGITSVSGAIAHFNSGDPVGYVVNVLFWFILLVISYIYWHRRNNERINSLLT